MARMRKTTSISEIASFYGGTANRDRSGKVRSVTIRGVRYSETGTTTLQMLRNQYMADTGVASTQSVQKTRANRVIANTKANTKNFKAWEREVRREFLKFTKELDIRFDKHGNIRSNETSVEQMNRKMQFETKEDIMRQLGNKIRHIRGLAYEGNVDALISTLRYLLIQYQYERETDMMQIIDYLEGNKQMIPDKMITTSYQIIYDIKDMFSYHIGVTQLYALWIG